MSTPYKKKLIEVALPLEDINREAAREKSIRHGHPSTLHLWWARRPLAACRAVLFASLVDDPSECVEELLAQPAKRRAAEKLLAARLKVWNEATAFLEKAKSAGISAPPPGAKPKLEELVAEIERERLFDIIRDLVKWENSNDERVLQAARNEILRSCNGKPPPVYDPFCGGGSIPLEAQRLGLEAHASDLNPVPVLITKALIEIPPKFAGKPPVHPLTADYADNTAAEKKSSVKSVSSAVNQTGSWKGAAGLAEDIRYYGKWMRDEAEKRIGHLYPKVKLPKEHGGGEATVIAWLWARTVASPNPAAKGAHVPLVRSFWLATRAGKRAWVQPVVDKNTMAYRFEVCMGNGEPRNGTVVRAVGECLLTGSPIPADYIKKEGQAGRFGARLIAVVAEGRRGRVYLRPCEEHEELARSVKLPNNVPDTELARNSQFSAPPLYGMTRHRDLFTTRQLVMLTTFSDLAAEARAKVVTDSGGNEVYADAVATYLGFGVSKLADYNSSLVVWSPTRDQAKPTFSRQAFSMAWDFAEVNSFAEAAGDLTVSVRGITESLERSAAFGPAVCRQADAAKLEGSSLVFSTDPPYYDNVPYAHLSDFFYIWLRRCLQPVYPELLGTVLVPKADELVADMLRHGGKEGAHAFFERGMGQVFGRMREASDPLYPTTIYYAFKQSEENEGEDDDGDAAAASRSSTGWETFLQGLVDAGWQIDGTWPIRTERGVRTRSLGSNALASSIVLVCRPRPKEARVASRRDFLAALKRELPEALRNLQKGNTAPVDLAQAAIGPGMAAFSRYAKVMESDGSAMTVRAALAEINKSLDEVLAEQEGEFDADTRWALAWFDQYGFGEGPYGTAETLSTAKNTSVDGMKEAGILLARAGKVRLLRAEELAADWDPATDERLTMWEVTHYLIRELDAGGSQSAGGLLARLTPLQADGARDLAYRLYSICERRKWAKEALAYNALVTTWAEVGRRASEVSAAMLKQTDLGM
jgi:putative DNA methylase